MLFKYKTLWWFIDKPLGSSIIIEKDEKVIASWRGDREVREKVVIDGGLTETTKNMTRPPKILKSL
ncbi:MAG: hypothetical protein QXP16_06490 [Candidatus Bathyarchaeia archaeon]